jgi:hypothetical protein
VQRAVRHRHERLDRLEPGWQHGALALVEVSYGLSPRRLRQASGRKLEGGAWVWHVLTPRIVGTMTVTFMNITA